jgi:uncharacterized protein (DUF4415 family)
MSDEDIDFSEIPALSDVDLDGAVRGVRPSEKREVTLWLDDQVFPWLQQQNEASFLRINHILRREMQRQQRKVAEKNVAQASTQNIAKAS